MEENEKPFACLTDGCNMRFTNEDHLTVHQKKHDMILNLGNGQKMNTFVADQTPTPTRFIRNCEEVGLFQDLQINPFDETFRKAVEAGKSGSHSQFGDSLHLPASVDDTLHTPHVFPFPNSNEDTHHYKRKISNDNLLRSVSNDSTSGLSAGTESIIVPTETNIIQLPSVSNVAQAASNSPSPRPIHPSPKPVKRPPGSADVALESRQETVRVAGQGMQLLLRMPDGKLVQLVQEKKPSPPVNVTPIPTPENGLALAKMKLKQALTNNGRIPTASSEPKEKAPTVRVERPPTPSSSPQDSRRESSNGSGEEGDERKVKFRERNRAAAMRCREKRKTWVQELERRAEEMQATNQQLQGEVTALRAEVAQLKTLLLAHKNCPITQAMNQGQMINVSTLPMETIQTCLLPTSQPSRIMFQPTVSTSHQPPAIAPLREPAKPSPSPAKRQRLGTSSPQKRTLTSEAKASDDSATSVNGRVARSVVVSNPVQSTSRPHIVNLPTNAPPYINFKHLLSACATNENNLNLEKSGAMMNSFDDSDGDRSDGSGNTITLEGTESKVIKLNPNAVRFRNSDEIYTRDRNNDEEFVIIDEIVQYNNNNADDDDDSVEVIIDS